MTEVPSRHRPDWPHDFDPAILFHDDGAVNMKQVEWYIETYLRKNETDEVSPLQDKTLQTHLYSVDYSIDDEPEEPDVPWDVLKRENPIDYAITMYMAHSILNSIQYSRVPTNPALEENPDIRFDLQTELSRFIGFAEEMQATEFSFMQSAQEIMGESANNVEDLRCVVAIAVAGHQEYKNIYHTLAQFAKQKLPASQFEIVPYLNLPGKDGSNDHELADSLSLTVAEIERFKSDYPDVVVREFANTYRADGAVIGGIRADLWNVVAYDMQVRGREQDILVISSDADVVGLSTEYLSDMCDEFETSGADVVTAGLLWQPVPGLPFEAAANRILRFQSYLDHVRDKHNNRLHTADANTGISLAAYMAVGGYDRNAKLGEMNDIIDRLRYYRQSFEQREAPDYKAPEQPMEVKAKKAKLRSNSRRLVRAMALGHSPYSAWDQSLIKFGTDDSLRTEEMQADAAERNAQEKGSEWATKMTGPYIRNMDPAKSQRVIAMARKVFGFEELES